MQLNLDRDTIDHIISLADFGEYTFISNDGAEYDGDSIANTAMYFSPPQDDDTQPESDSECHDLEVMIVGGKFSIQCEVMINASEVEDILNSKANSAT